ncbi:MAG: FkbM family methyltransferase [Bacteroidales bacterium]|jgi:FkbM family methyltransferase|nr:FkbM family methyltransferase [Bacteroidales bacterium]MCU0408279.1 FkbM family methyltransferase [Bacteroidales bacterium]
MKEVKINSVTFKAGDNNLQFWEKVNSNTWEIDTFRIFDRFADSETVYFDIGAWIGPTVMYAAQRARRAFAFEPDPVAFGILKENLNLNGDSAWAGRITLYNKAVSAADGYINIGSKSGGGDSLSSSLFADDGTSWKVESVSVPAIISENKLEASRMLFKIDIEGGEYELIPALNETFSKHDSVLFLSFHPGNLFAALKGKNNSFLNRLSCWRKVIMTHCRITGALPYKHRYLQSGRTLTRLSMLYYTFRLRSFSIVASNEKW